MHLTLILIFINAHHRVFNLRIVLLKVIKFQNFSWILLRLLHFHVDVIDHHVQLLLKWSFFRNERINCIIGQIRADISHFCKNRIYVRQYWCLSSERRKWSSATPEFNSLLWKAIIDNFDRLVLIIFLWRASWWLIDKFI